MNTVREELSQLRIYRLEREMSELNNLLDDRTEQRDLAIDAIIRLGHTEVCANRLAFGDGKCACKAA